MATLTLFVALLAAVQTHSFVVPNTEQLAILNNELRHDDPSLGLQAQNKKDVPGRIAIIGSGITGASAAARLYEGFRFEFPPDQQPSITVFERNENIGGRFTQAYAYDDQMFPVDTCAATFSISDVCIAQSATNVGLPLSQLELQQPVNGTGIWDGSKMVAFVEENGFRGALTWPAYRRSKWGERYDAVPTEYAIDVSQQRLIFDTLLPPILLNGVIGATGRMNLSEQLDQAQLLGLVRNPTCGKQGIPSLDDSEQGLLFSDEVANAAVRERFFADANQLNELELYLGFEDEFPSFIAEGNLRLIERLLRLSTCDVRLNTGVQKIERKKDGTFDLTIIPTGGGTPISETFNIVVMASSLELANITFEPTLPKQPGLEQKYENSFVTHFTTPNYLNPEFFNRTGPMPQKILTTVTKDDDGSDREPPFFSLTLLRQIVRPNRGANGVDNLFKLVSREEVPFGEIEKYLYPNGDITWIDRQPLPFKTVPIVDPTAKSCRTILEDIEIAPGLYYAGGGEQVVATAEFGCRMGANAANLVLDAARGIQE